MFLASMFLICCQSYQRCAQLGPILFIIFTNDIDSVCHGRTSMKLFADDAKLYSEINLNDCSWSLQTSFNNLATWAFAWQLSIIVQKCCVLSTVINKRTSHSGSNKYYLNEVLLTNNVNVLDLGITISADLSYNAYINNIVERYSDRVLYFVVLLHAIFNSCVKLLSLTLDLYLSIIVSCGV